MSARTHDERESNLAVMEIALLDGRSVAEVVDAAMRNFGVSKSAAYDDVAVIKDRWARNRHADSGSEFGKAVARRERLIGRALRVASKAEANPGEEGVVLSAINTAAGLERDKSKLLALYPDKTLTIHTAREKTAEEMTDEELMAVINAGTESGEISDEELAAIAGVNDDTPPAASEPVGQPASAPSPDHFRDRAG